MSDPVAPGGAIARIFAEGLDHPEGLAVAPDGSIWAGGEEGQIFVVSPEGGVREHARTGGFSGGMAFDRDGSCIVCNSPGRLLRVADNGRWEVLADAVDGTPMRAPNFPVFGPDGSLYVSDSGSWGTADGVIYRFAPDGTGEVFHPGPFDYANGLAIDAGGEHLYVVETGRHTVVRLRIADGANGVAELVCPENGLEWVPDGLAFDAAGALYVTLYATDRIVRIAPGGPPEVLVSDAMGMTLNRPTNCAFGGPDGNRLFVANLGGRHLSVIDLEVRGQPLYGGPG